MFTCADEERERERLGACVDFNVRTLILSNEREYISLRRGINKEPNVFYLRLLLRGLNSLGSKSRRPVAKY